MPIISKAFEFFAGSPAKADSVPESIPADVGSNIQEIQAETDLVSDMNQIKQGRGRPRKQQEEPSISRCRKTRSTKLTVDQDQKQPCLSKSSTPKVDKKKGITSSLETRASGQELKQEDSSEDSGASEDRKQSKESIIETRHNTRQSCRVSAGKHQGRSKRFDQKQQKGLTEYFQSSPSQSRTSKARVNKKICKDDMEKQNKRGQTPKAGTPRMTSDRKVNESKNKDEEPGEKSCEQDKDVSGKENQGIKINRRRGRPAKLQKNPDVFKGVTEKSSKKELLRESPISQTLGTGLNSSSGSSDYQDNLTSKKGLSVVASPAKIRSNIVDTPEFSKSKKTSQETPLFHGPEREMRRTNPVRGCLANTKVRSVKKNSPTLSRSKTSSPKTPDNSFKKKLQKMPTSKQQDTTVPSPSQDVKINSPVVSQSKIPVFKSSSISPGKVGLKITSKSGEECSPVVSSPRTKIDKKSSLPLVSGSHSLSSMMSTPARSCHSATRLIASPRYRSLTVSRSSLLPSSPVRRLQSREHKDMYGEGCSGIGAGSSSLEDSEEFVVPSCSRQTMSPLTDDDKDDESSGSEYDVDDEEACITDAMKVEENKIHQQNVKEENKEKVEYMDEWAAMQESQKFARLQHLLNKSNIYCQFLLKRMEEQRAEEEKKQKRIAKRQENKEMKETAKQQQVQRRSGRRKENDQVDSQGSSDNNQPEPVLKTKRGKKRKAEQTTGKLSDYITEEAIVKRQKMNDSKSPARTPLRDCSPEQRVPNTPKDHSPKEGKSVAVEGDVAASQPSLLTGGVMRSYQIEGLEWLKVLYENGVNGILADEMGLGKTVQCIGLIAHLIEMGVKGPFLVAAPLSTLPNWVSEFHRFTPKIPVILYHGSIDERTTLRRKISKLVNVGGFVSQPVVVTSYEICMNDQKHLYNFRWKHMIVDEGHRIKNLNCRLIRELKTYDSANRLLLTGTPLQNNLQELWSLLNFLLPDIFDDLSSFQRLFDFSAIGDEESKERILAQEREHQVLKTLHSILTPFLLRRLKSDVELSLPPKKELLVYAPLTHRQTTLYKAALDKTIENLVGPQKNKKEEVIEMNSAGRPVRKNRQNIDYRVFDAQDFEALSNTLSEMKTSRGPETTNQQQDSIVSLPLRNILMLLRKCCNHPYLLEYPLDSATQQFKIDEELVSCSGKMKILDQLLKGLRSRGHKVLIFSQMTKMLDILEDLCYLRKYEYCRLDGTMSVQDRRQQMKAFTTDSNVFLFLLSTRAGGLGLNLSAADTVIIYDSDWNPQADLQAQDRCHRIGQTKPIVVYRLVTANTVDQKMVEKASSKRRLEKLVIHKGKFKGKLDDNVLSAEELSELLEAASHDQVIANDRLLLSKKQVDTLLDRSDLIAQHNKKTRTVPDVDSTDSALFKVIDSSS